jgi:hypothetical protein
MYNWLADLTSLYQAQEAWNQKTYNAESVYHLHHGLENNASFSIACGASLFSEHIRRFRFSPEIIQKLGQVTDEKGRCVFEESFLNFLQRMKLSVSVKMPQEGTLLLPNEPLMILQGSQAQVLLLSSAMHQLVWRSSQWATQAAMQRWEKRTFKEENTARSPKYEFNPEGWYARASFIGGANVKSISINMETLQNEVVPNRLELVWMSGLTTSKTNVLQQIRRTYKGIDPVGDIWMSADQEKNISVSKTQADFLENGLKEVKTLKFTRFQQLYVPLLVNGRPVVTPTRKGFLRQRTLHQLAAFQKVKLEGYSTGWLME